MCPFGGKLVFIYNYFKARRGDGSRDTLFTGFHSFMLFSALGDKITINHL